MTNKTSNLVLSGNFFSILIIVMDPKRVARFGNKRVKAENIGASKGRSFKKLTSAPITSNSLMICFS
jgi:hypothetical protein